MEKKLHLTMENFPFDSLRLADKGRVSDYETVQQNTFIEKDGRLMDYDIEFPSMQSSSISYYVDPKKNDPTEPKFYVYFTLHPHWTDPKPDGKVSKEESESGKLVEEFFKKFRVALIAAAKRLPQEALESIMGVDRSQDLEKAFADAIPHEKFPKGHPKQNQQNLDKSRQLQAALWSQDQTKKKVDGNNKRKDSEDLLLVPQTTHAIYTSIYDAVPIKKKKGSKKRRNNNKGKEEELEVNRGKIVKYDDMKKFVFSSSACAAHNTAKSRATLISDTRLMAPVINWNPSKNTAGEQKWKLAMMKIFYCNAKAHSRDLDDSQVAQLMESRKRAMADFRLPEDDDDDSSDEEDSDEEEGSGDADSYESIKRKKLSMQAHQEIKTSTSNSMNVDNDRDEAENTEEYRQAVESAHEALKK